MLKYFSNIYNLYWKHKSFLPKKQYSCFGEDIFIMDFFEKDNKGFYVDVGSYHPFFWNNTYLLYKKKWNGINLDLNPLTIELFNFSRPRDINLNTALSRKSGIKNFYYFGEFSPLNTLDKNHLRFLKKNFNVKRNEYKIKKIKTKNINSILNKYKFNRIDFLNIDLEGQEYEVLRDFDFKKYKIDLISVEMLSHNILSKKTSIKLNKLLVRNKFKFIYKTGVNFFYKNTKWNYQ